MQVLAKLWFVKYLAMVRNLFRKWTSALLTIFMIMLYVGIFMSLVLMPKETSSKMYSEDANFAILLILGLSVIFVLTLLLQKRKALFFEEDSFYLFSGPFTRKQIMAFLIGQTVLGSCLFSLSSLFILSGIASNISFQFDFLALSFLCYFMLFLFWMNLSDYLYILSISKKKYNRISKLIAAMLILLCVAIYGITLAQNNFQFSNSVIVFAESNLFYGIPIFGWVKLVLVSLLMHQTNMVLLGIALLIISNVVLAYFFINFKGDFYEQAMQDSMKISKYMKDMKTGKRSSIDMHENVKDVNATFKEGAAAVFSKNVLLMKKTNGYIRKQDIFIIIFYFLLTLITSRENGFIMYCYLITIWILTQIQESDMLRELKNYQIYLIPDSPFKKLLYVILPTFLKISMLSGVALIAAGLYFHIDYVELIQYISMILGYIFLFICSSVLSVRILKSRSNIVIENMIRLCIIIVSVIPSGFIVIFIISTNIIGVFDIITQATIISLAMNFIMSFLILFSCKNMMNGREISSE